MANDAIDKLRYQGYGYRKIATLLDLPLGRVKSYCYRHPLDLNVKRCLECGKEIQTTPHKRERKFCSDSCRNKWWKDNRHLMKKKTFYKITCKNCGCEFESYGNNLRIYCSRSCYLEARWKVGAADEK